MGSGARCKKRFSRQAAVSDVWLTTWENTMLLHGCRPFGSAWGALCAILSSDERQGLPAHYRMRIMT